MKSKYINRILSFLLIVLLLASCEKYLDEKSNQQLATPDTVDDLQALLDNESFYRYTLAATQSGSDEFFVPVGTYDTRPDLLKYSYSWDGEKLDDYQDWSTQYELVLIANTVL